MKNFKEIWQVFLCCIVVALLIPVMAWADVKAVPENTLSLESVIKTVLSQNPDIAMARERLAMAQDTLDKTRALFLPRVSAYAEAKTGDSPSAYLFKTIDQRTLLPGTDFNDPGKVNNVEAGLRCHLNLFRGGRDQAAVNMAKSHVRQEKAFGRKTENLMVSSAIRLFFSILKAKSYIAIARQSVDTIEEQLRIMNVHFEGGGVLRSDLLSLEVRLTQAKRDLIHAQNSHAVALTGLNVLLGNLPDTSLILEEQCHCPFRFPDTYQEAVKIALENRPEMIMAEQMLETARWKKRSAKGQYLPGMDVNGTWYTDADGGNFDSRSNNYVLELSMNWDLFTGNTTRLDLATAEKARLLAERNMEKVRLSIYQEVKQAYLNHEDALQRLSVTRKGEEMSEESLALIARRYEGGSDSVGRYLDAELDRSQSRMNQAAAFYDEKIALSDMALSLGILSRIWESPTTTEQE